MSRPGSARGIRWPRDLGHNALAANGFNFTATFSWTEYAEWDQTTVLQVHTRTAAFDSMTIRLVNDIMYADGSVGLIENLAMLPHGSEGFMSFRDVNVAC